MAGHVESGPNYRGHSTLALSVVFVLLALIAVSARLLTRKFIVNNAGRDDLCVAVAWLFSLGLTVTMGLQVQNGLGQHQDTLSDAEVTRMLKAFWASLWLYYLALGFTKVALILQYLRIFTQTWFRRSAWALLAIVVTYTVWGTMSSVFSCIPIAAFWNHAEMGTCLPHSVSWYVNAGINIATDLATVILPMPVINQLQLPRRQRFALLAVFALGSFVVIVSVIRIKSLNDVANSTDVSFSNPAAAEWSVIEVNVGIICASLPSLKATAARFFPRVFSISRSASSFDQISGRGPGRSGLKHNGWAQSRLSIECASDPRGPGGLGYSTSQVRSHVSGNKGGNDGSMDTEMHALSRGAQAMGENKINVVTVLEQEVHRSSRVPSSDSGSWHDKYGSPGAESDSDTEKGLPLQGRRRDYGDHFERYAARP